MRGGVACMRRGACIAPLPLAPGRTWSMPSRMAIETASLSAAKPCSQGEQRTKPVNYGRAHSLRVTPTLQAATRQHARLTPHCARK